MIYLIKSFSIRLLYEEIAKIIGKNTNIIRMNMDEITISEVINECLYYSLLKEHKYVIVNNFKLSKENQEIISYAEHMHSDTTLILIADGIDKRSVIYKAINEKGKIILIEEVKDLSNKINAYCKSNDIMIDYLAINKLLENNLNNYDLVLAEIDKIQIITNKITTEIVEKYSPKLISEDNFEFCSAVIKKNYKLIEGYLDDFIKLKCEPAPFIGLMASQYRLMYSVKCLNGTNEEIAKELNVHPYRVKLAKENGYAYSKDELQKKLLDLCDLDYNIKTTGIDKYILLKIFLVNL